MTKNVAKNVTLMNAQVDKQVVVKQNKRRFLDSGQCGSGGSSIPDSCMNPQAQGATSCDFYSSCLEKAHQCGNSGYALNFGEKFCKKFLDLNSDPTMSTLEKQWMKNVRQCLQDAAVPLVYDSSLTCSEIQTKAFATHPPCYTNGGVICQNPSLWVQLVKVIGWNTLKPGVLSNAASVLGYCVSDPKTYLAMAKTVGKVFGTVAKATVSFADAAAKWIGDSVVNLVEGMYHWWGARLFSSKLLTKGPDVASSYKTSVQQMMTLLGQFYGNMSTACNMSRSDNQCPNTFKTNMTMAAQVFSQPSKWLIVEKTKDIRLYDRPDVRFDQVFQNLSSVCSTGKYDSCAGNAALVAWITVGVNTSTHDMHN